MINRVQRIIVVVVVVVVVAAAVVVVVVVVAAAVVVVVAAAAAVVVTAVITFFKTQNKHNIKNTNTSIGDGKRRRRIGTENNAFLQLKVKSYPSLINLSTCVLYSLNN